MHFAQFEALLLNTVQPTSVAQFQMFESSSKCFMGAIQPVFDLPCNAFGQPGSDVWKSVLLHFINTDMKMCTLLTKGIINNNNTASFRQNILRDSFLHWLSVLRSPTFSFLNHRQTDTHKIINIPTPTHTCRLEHLSHYIHISPLSNPDI